MTSFHDLGLAEPISHALADERYEQPTPIQAQTIPQVLAGRDVVGIAQTGTGKTAAFALPILQRLGARRQHPPRSCRVLVLSPTRELSAQIVDSFNAYGRYLRPSVALAIGGVNIKPQVRALAGGVDVLVATPGRLIDLLDQRALTLDKVEVFVLDEADRMLDMGFIHDIRRIVGKLPSRRQTLFFSATMPREIADLAASMLRDPVEVAVTPAATTVERIEQRVLLVDRNAKPALLAQLLRSEPIDRVLVFTRTKHGADKVVRTLARAEIAAAAIHGNKSQNQRERVLAAFRSGQIRTLVATDIAARGIDVEGISHVINFDLPNIPESYVHRIGRTARAGADGIAISFCDAEERAYLRDIEKLIRRTLPLADHRTGPQSNRGTEQMAKPNLGGNSERGNSERGNSERGKSERGKSEQGSRHAQPRSEPNGKSRKRRRKHAPPRPTASQPHQPHPHQPHPHHGHAKAAARPHAAAPSSQRSSPRQPASEGNTMAAVAFMQPTRRAAHHSPGNGRRPGR